MKGCVLDVFMFSCNRVGSSAKGACRDMGQGQLILVLRYMKDEL